ncbi:hypothetical protein [Chryseobacterium takakiae]|uniref:Uncharacterized protein n=1 Tax=Chryseobacterium takakiae TaxID=1302685 RepID=A0A1M5AV60_9FLAO|nr:hypothetical protein [Chryseobacterium takakiae]SHF34016.1 hypothetical protein SAMN05444408_11540 [Chryseobacterium takakiae]
MRNILTAVLVILSLVMCGQKNFKKAPARSKEVNMETTENIEIDKLISQLRNSMNLYMEEASPGYSEKDIDECILILSEYSKKMIKTHSKEEAMLLVRRTVLQLNTLNQKCGNSLIETDERERIAGIIILVSHKMGYNSMDDDITEEWREW